MARYENILQAIGHTPLIRLQRIGADIASPIYAKVESLNPGGSVKDRVGSAMVEAAEKAGLLKSGGTIVEATAGNTGVGLALVAAVKGYRLVVVLPDKMSAEIINLLRAERAAQQLPCRTTPVFTAMLRCLHFLPKCGRPPSAISRIRSTLLEQNGHIAPTSGLITRASTCRNRFQHLRTSTAEGSGSEHRARRCV
jgi:hypothetical protein